MRITAILGLLFFGFYALDCRCEDLKSHIQFASLEKAKLLLTTEDQFTNSWSQFDIDSRLHKANGKKDDLLKYISSQTREWKENEKEKINFILDSIDHNITSQGFKINFPQDIYFVKTTAVEEGGAEAYTRANYIVLKESNISNSEKYLRELILHELFHILTRNDSNFRRTMYRIIGFELMDEIAYPGSIKNLKITNPDAPLTDSYIGLKKDNKPIECTMILYSKSAYNGGAFFKYLTVGFLKLKGIDKREADNDNGKPIVYAQADLEGFYEQVGKNTHYIIHPEEVLADNFIFAVENKRKLKSQWLVDKIREKLKE